MNGEVIIPDIPELNDEVLDYDRVLENYYKVLDYVADLYV
jgi:formate C-acetyltransferase